MNTYFLKKARQHFACGIRKIDRHNQRAYVRSIRFLGPRWLLAKPINRPQA